MKKRIRTQPTNPFYSNEPAVARGLIAGKSPVQNASLGNSTPKIVDKKPGKISGLAGFSEHKKPRDQKIQKIPQVNPLKSGAAKPSPVPKQGGSGHLRMSGNPLSHRLGIKPIKLKI